MTTCETQLVQITSSFAHSLMTAGATQGPLLPSAAGEQSLGGRQGVWRHTGRALGPLGGLRGSQRGTDSLSCQQVSKMQRGPFLSLEMGLWVTKAECLVWGG